MIDLLLAAALSPDTSNGTWFGITLGEPISQVRAQLGDPLNENDLGQGITKSRYLVDDNTALLGVDRKDGAVVMLSLTSAGNKSSTAADPFGIQLGATEAAVQQARGKPGATDDGDGANRLLYGTAPMWHYIFHDGVLGMIIVTTRSNDASPTTPDPPLHTGASIADAIVIKNETEMTGVGWEYAYLAYHPCNAEVQRKMVKQSLVTQAKHDYDVLQTSCPGQLLRENLTGHIRPRMSRQYSSRTSSSISTGRFPA